MGSLEELLRPHESVEFETRRHAGRLAGKGVSLVVAVGILLTARQAASGTAAEGAVAWGTAGLAGLMALRLLVEILRWRAEAILVTDRRIIAATGLFRRRITSVPLRRIEDLSLDRSFGGRLWGSGDVLIDMDDRRLRLARIPDPKAFYRLVMTLADDEGPEPPGDDAADTGPLPRVPI